jgi:fatty acid desaturase
MAKREWLSDSSNNLARPDQLSPRFPMTEYTEEQKASFKEQWAAMRRRDRIRAAPVVIFFAALGVFLARKNQGLWLGVPAEWALTVLFVLAIGSVIFSLRNWRCPACRRMLGSEMSPRFCSKCGIALK